MTGPDRLQEVQAYWNSHPLLSHELGDLGSAAFFDRFRWLALCGFYTTEAGRKDVGYIGNIPLDEFRGATAEQLKYLGLA